MHTPTASRPGRHLHEAEAILAVLLIIVLGVVVISQQNAPARTADPAQNAVAAADFAAKQQRQEDLKDAWLTKRGVTSVGAASMRPGEDTLSAEWLAQRMAATTVAAANLVEDPHDAQKEKLMIQHRLIVS
jgi:hypothetical protein